MNITETHYFRSIIFQNTNLPLQYKKVITIKPKIIKQNNKNIITMAQYSTIAELQNFIVLDSYTKNSILNEPPVVTKVKLLWKMN